MQWVEIVKSCSWGQFLFTYSDTCWRMHLLATIHFVTDRRTDITCQLPIAQYDRHHWRRFSLRRRNARVDTVSVVVSRHNAVSTQHCSALTAVHRRLGPSVLPANEPAPATWLVERNSKTSFVNILIRVCDLISKFVAGVGASSVDTMWSECRYLLRRRFIWQPGKGYLCSNRPRAYALLCDEAYA